MLNKKEFLALNTSPCTPFLPCFPLFSSPMNPQTFFKFKTSLHFLIIFITTTAFKIESLPLSDCFPQNCGNGPNISYPFWIPSLQEPHCGSPGFEIICNRNHSILPISNDEYIVKHIFHSNHSILVAKAEVYDEQNKCPIPLQNFSTDLTVFSYSPSTTDLFFFYNCSFPNREETYAVDCASNASNHAFAVFHPELLDHWNYSSELCQTFVNSPVVAESISRLLEMNFTDILKNGFVLQWDTVNCSDCERSGGRCNSHNNEFVCVCSDGRLHTRTCHSGNGLNEPQKIGIGIGVAGTGILLICLVFFIYHRRFRKRYASSLMSRNISSDPSSITDLEKSNIYFGVHIFSYAELEEATNNFDSKKELGDGGFGTVYKGKLRDGRVVAVKRLYENNFKRVEQFMNEVEILTRLRHQNLVTLYGCTSRHCRELLLVYEYIPNGTVADHLHGDRAGKGLLTWKTRMSIAVETASALAFLHASDVIHRDVKTNNILLESNFRVKVADFGLSRLFPTNVTHVSTAPQGTPGYVDPEYHHCYQLTDKSDVFSFGVVLVELISSMPAVDITRHRHEINLSTMAINKIQRRALNELVDPNLGFDSDYKARKMINDVAELAFQCLQNGREMRPSMEEVLEALKEIRRQDYGEENGDDDAGDVPPDDAVLLKSNPLILSPDSVTANWVSSNSTTTNASG